MIYLEALTKEGECDRCSQISHQVHQNHRYLVKDLPISGQAVYLKVNRRQFKCKNCGKPFSEELDWVKKRRIYSTRLAREIVRVEGINNKIKLIKRSAYGFRNFDNFRTRVLLSWQFNC